MAKFYGSCILQQDKHPIYTSIDTKRFLNNIRIDQFDKVVFPYKQKNILLVENIYRSFTV